MNNTYQGILSFSPKGFEKSDISLIIIISKNRFKKTINLEQSLYTTHRQHSLPEKYSKGHHPNQRSNNNRFPRATKKGFSRLPLFWEQRNGLFPQREQKHTYQWHISYKTNHLPVHEISK